jgi:serine/threonine protein kinase
MRIEAGAQLSHYRLVEKVGEGGMGVVWKAEDTVLQRAVAIKLLPAEVSRDEKRRQMFLDEARFASRLNDAHIIQVHEFGREGELDFIVMEFVEGKPVKELIRGRPLAPEKIADIGVQVAGALARAHHKGLIHRDLKPANVIVTPEGEAKVVDFGLAALLQQEDSEAPTAVSVLGSTGEDAAHSRMLAGTLPYMSPEQIRGEPLDARTDVFSLGAVLYEMATGARPFPALTQTEIIEQVLRCRPIPPQELVPDLPVELGRIVQKALARDKADRYQSMDDLTVDMKQLLVELEAGSSISYADLAAVRPARRPWRSWAALALALGAGVVLAGTAAWWLSRSAAPILDDRTVLVTPMPTAAPLGESQDRRPVAHRADRREPRVEVLVGEPVRAIPVGQHR